MSAAESNVLEVESEKVAIRTLDYLEQEYGGKRPFDRVLLSGYVFPNSIATVDGNRVVYNEAYVDENVLETKADAAKTAVEKDIGWREALKLL